MNVLIALLDEQHQHYERANTWFTSEPERWWLTCPITENGVVRIIASPSYTASLPMREIHGYFRVLAEFGNHAFVPDDISLMDEIAFRLDQIRSPKQITDTYLLALSARHDAVFATLDARINRDAVRAPYAEVFLIP